MHKQLLAPSPHEEQTTRQYCESLIYNAIAHSVHLHNYNEHREINSVQYPALIGWATAGKTALGRASEP
jgi:hypothetical protein